LFFFFLKALSNKTCIFRGVLEEFGFKNNMFLPSEIAKMHGEEKIDSRKQHPAVFSFNPQAVKSKQFCKSFTINQYYVYQQENLDGISQDFVYFAVNIDIGHWKDHMEELEKVPKQIFCQSSFDSLAYLKQPILGITSPQLYMKVKGCWTGGHMENMNLQAVNINHGNIFLNVHY